MTETLVFIGTVIEKTEKRHEGSGVLESTDRLPVVFQQPIVATDVDLARCELIAMAKEAKSDLNMKMLEITCCPFR